MSGNHSRPVRYGMALLGLSALAVVVAGPAQANGVVDGSFSKYLTHGSPTDPRYHYFQGWTEVYYKHQGYNHNRPAPMALQGTSSDPSTATYAILHSTHDYGITQAANTQVGQKYTLTFLYQSPDGTADSVDVLAGGVSLVSGLTTSASGWQTATYNFIGTGSKTSLEFDGHSTANIVDHGMYITNVSIAPVPEFGSILGLGGLVAAGGFAGFRRRKRKI